MYTLDTNFIIYYQKDEPEVVNLFESFVKQSIPLYVYTATEVELLSHAPMTAEEESKIQDLLLSFSIISVDSQIAQKAGFLRRTCGLKTIDAMIAATAMFTGSTLLTRNIKDFKKVPELKLQKI